MKRCIATFFLQLDSRVFNDEQENLNFDKKLELALTKMTPVSKLQGLLELDERTQDGKEPNVLTINETTLSFTSFYFCRLATPSSVAT